MVAESDAVAETCSLKNKKFFSLSHMLRDQIIVALQKAPPLDPVYLQPKCLRRECYGAFFGPHCYPHKVFIIIERKIGRYGGWRIPGQDFNQIFRAYGAFP